VDETKTFQHCLPSSVANAQTYRLRTRFILSELKKKGRQIWIRLE
jgi:hypothetical protein